MNPSYRYQIDVRINALRSSEDVVLRRVGYLPFVPREGDVLRFTADKTDDTMDIGLSDGHYDVAGGVFTFKLEDNQVYESPREGEPVTQQEVIDVYTPFDFVRLRNHG